MTGNAINTIGAFLLRSTKLASEKMNSADRCSDVPLTSRTTATQFLKDGLSVRFRDLTLDLPVGSVIGSLIFEPFFSVSGVPLSIRIL